MIWITILIKASEVKKRQSNVGGSAESSEKRHDDDDDWDELLGRYVEEEKVEQQELGRGQRSKSKKVDYYKHMRPATKKGSKFITQNICYYVFG